MAMPLDPEGPPPISENPGDKALDEVFFLILVGKKMNGFPNIFSPAAAAPAVIRPTHRRSEPGEQPTILL